jgi:hypothetical protein
MIKSIIKIIFEVFLSSKFQFHDIQMSKEEIVIKTKTNELEFKREEI